MDQYAARNVRWLNRLAQSLRNHMWEGVALDGPDQRTPAGVLPELEASPGIQGRVVAERIHVRPGHAGPPEGGKVEHVVQRGPAASICMNA